MTLDWDKATVGEGGADAPSYVVHMGETSDPKDAVIMYYTETNSLTVNDALTGETLSGKTKYFWVQAYDRLGNGATDVDKAQDLNLNALGSQWSQPPLEVTYAV